MLLFCCNDRSDSIICNEELLMLIIIKYKDACMDHQAGPFQKTTAFSSASSGTAPSFATVSTHR